MTNMQISEQLKTKAQTNVLNSIDGSLDGNNDFVKAIKTGRAGNAGSQEKKPLIVRRQNQDNRQDASFNSAGVSRVSSDSRRKKKQGSGYLIKGITEKNPYA